MRRVVIIGAGGHARVAIDAIEARAKEAIVGIVDNKLKKGTSFLGYPIIGDDAYFKGTVAIDGVFVAIGDNWRRQIIVNFIKKTQPYLPFLSVIHPYAFVAKDVLIGGGAIVLAGAIINSGCRVGEHCIINTKASIDHDNVLEDFVSVGPGATLGGSVILRKGAVVGLGANIIHGVEIGEHSIVGAGALALDNVASHVIVVGMPAHKLRDRLPDDAYL